MIIIKAEVGLMVRCQKVYAKATDRWMISACVVPQGLLLATHAFMNKIWTKHWPTWTWHRTCDI